MWLIMLAFIVGIWGIGGSIGAVMWNLMVFILAPAAVLATIIQLIVIIIRVMKKKRISWSIVFMATTIVIALPASILIGKPLFLYPTEDNQIEKIEKIEIVTVVENATYYGYGENEHITHAIWPSECYAYDLLVEPYEVGSANNEDYGIWGASVYAPVSGRIIGVENREEDIPPNASEFASNAGNYVYIEDNHHKVYFILSHFMQDSIVVSEGDYVEAGQYLGKVGNSGTTSEPHLHLQCQRDNPLEISIPTVAVGVQIELP